MIMNIAESLEKCGLDILAETPGLKIKNLRLGLGYSCVELDNDAMGVAWTPDKRQSGNCTHLREAGNIKGISAQEALGWLNSEIFLERTVGLSVFNALNSKVERNLSEEEAISLLELKPDEHVVMIGYFAPVIPKIKESGCTLEIVELIEDKRGVITPEKGFEALKNCDVAIITATSIINNTVDKLLASLERNRAAMLLGPSTPICPEAFAETRVTQLSGSYVLNNERIKTIVSEGGGTMLLKKHLKFATIQF
jgi:hypothetical protein